MPKWREARKYEKYFRAFVLKAILEANLDLLELNAV